MSPAPTELVERRIPADVAVSYTFALANVQGTDPRAAQRRTLNSTLRDVDYAIFNEARDTAQALIRALSAVWAWFIPAGGAGLNPHVWRVARFTVARKWQRLIMRGGRGHGSEVGPVRRAFHRRFRGRRRGPNRFLGATLAVIDGYLVLHVGTHLIAKWTTDNRWRRPLALASVQVLKVYLLWLRRHYPGVPIVLAGDMNTSARLPLSAGWRRVPLPADYGRRHYSQVYLWGAIEWTNARERHNESDHDAMVVDLHIRSDAREAA